MYHPEIRNGLGSGTSEGRKAHRTVRRANVGVPWWLSGLRVTTVVQSLSLAWEFLHAAGMTKKKKERQKKEGQIFGKQIFALQCKLSQMKKLSPVMALFLA